MKKSNKLLIVGGTGFIGINVTKEAVKRGFHVSVISKKKYLKLEQISEAKYISVDITDAKSLLFKLKGLSFDYVLNLGGYVDHSNYFNGGDEIINVHFNGTKNLVNCIDKDNLKGFIQIGSSDEYGDNTAPQNENHRELPISPYSFAKVASTHFLQMLYRTEGFPVVILRPFLVYGPEQDDNRFIPQIIKGCLNNEKFSVSHGEQLRDFCYIDDVVDAIFLSIKNDDCFGKVINIASGEAISIKDVITNIQNIIGMGKPQFGKVPYRVGENMELYANICKAKNLLKWVSKVGLKHGLRKTINFYREI